MAQRLAVCHIWSIGLCSVLRPLPTQYRLFGRRFLHVKIPSQSYLEYTCKIPIPIQLQNGAIIKISGRSKRGLCMLATGSTRSCHKRKYHVHNTHFNYHTSKFYDKIKIEQREKIQIIKFKRIMVESRPRESRLIEQGLTSPPTQYRLYRRRFFTGRKTQPTVSKY